MSDFSFLKNNPDLYKYNLHLRSIGQPASYFEWQNALEADGVPILARTKNTDIDPNIRADHNVFEQIQQEKSSYIASNIDIIFGDAIPEDVRKKYEDLEKRIFLKNIFKDLMESCSGWGNTYLLGYLNEKYQPEFKEIYSWNAQINPENGLGYVIETEKGKKTDTKTIRVFEYNNLTVRQYEGNEYEKMQLVGEWLHGFTLMPLIEFTNNKNKRGNAEKAVSLMDAYDRIIADNLTEWSSLRQAYLLLKDVGNFDKEDKRILKQLAVIMGRNEHSDARFVTKNLNPDFAKFITERTWSSIWSTASCPDPNVLESLTNVTAFQISQTFRRLDANCQDTINEWQKSLQQFDDLLSSFWTGLDLQSIGAYDTYIIDYKFNKNIPMDIMTFLKDLKQAGANLPQEEMFIKAGYSQKDAEGLVKKATNEGKGQNNDNE